ncbi:MAG: serine hydrolase domain-containing protein [Planctomycetota bacterium]
MHPHRHAFAFLVLLASSVPAQDLAQKVDAAVAPHMQKPLAVGLSVGVAMGSETVAKGYGLADVEFDVPVNGATAFRIGSITKQFTAVLVMKLVEKGLVGLEDPLQKHVPEFATEGKQVTVRQLLDHTSGIKSYTDLGPKWEEKQPLELTHEQLLALVADEPFDFEPGSDWRYNNTGYYLLGVLLEKVTGKSYASLVADEIATPLSMTRTRYDSNLDLIKNRAQGYQFDGETIQNDAPLGMSQPFAAGALLSTGGDLVRWAQALTGGKVLLPASYERMTTTTVLPNGRDTHYAFGIGRDEFGGKLRLQHGGGINGFNSFLLSLPEVDFHVAVISNSERLSSRRVAEDLAYSVLGLERPKAEDKPTSKELRARLTGAFAIADLSLELEVFEKDDKLMVQAVGQSAFAILWQGEGEFRAAFDPSVKLVFRRDGSSFDLHQSGGVFEAKRK